MGKRFSKALAFVLVLGMMVMGIPAVSFAAVTPANDQLVVTGASIDVDDCSVKVSDKNITVTVPYNYSKSINADYVTLKYDNSVRDAAVSWNSGYQTVRPGGSVQGSVTYKVGDSQTQYKTNYVLKVVETAKKNPTVTGKITVTSVAGAEISFTSKDFESHYVQNDGNALAKIVIKSKAGVTNDGAFTVNGSKYSLGSDIAYKNRDAIKYTAGTVGKKEYTVFFYESGSSTPTGSVDMTITVKNPELETVRAGDVAAKEVMALPVTSINNEFKKAAGTKNDFSKLVFTELADSSKGVLYKDYKSASDKGTQTAVNQEYMMSDFLGGMTFVPVEGANGEAVYKFAVYDSNGISYEGKVVFNVLDTDIKVVSYTVVTGETVDFDTNDFAEALKSATTSALKSIEITELPSGTLGVLYSKYESPANVGTKVAEKDKYYKTGNASNLIQNLSFVAGDNKGTAYVKYVAYDSADKPYKGEVVINVKTATVRGSVDDIAYQSADGEKISLYASDFSAAYKKASGTDLSYVKFELPDAKLGKLYYNYQNAEKYDSAVNPDLKYYASSTADVMLGKVSFVPAEDYVGKVNIAYTAYDNSGNAYTGKVVVDCIEDAREKGADIDTIKYAIENTKTLKLSAKDINEKFRVEAGTELEYLYFALPDENCGKLYYGYKDDSSKGEAVTGSDAYYRNSAVLKLIDNITFVPAKGYTGTAVIRYSGFDGTNKAFIGVIKIAVSEEQQVDPPAPPVDPTKVSEYFTDVTQDYSWAAGMIDNLYEKGIVNGTGADATGKGKTYSPAAKITRGDFILMLYRAFDLKAVFTDNFADVPKDSYYYNAIGVAKALGIAQGAYGKFNPTDSLTREDAMVLINRAITVKGETVLDHSSDISSFKDGGKISSYAVSSVGTLVKAGIINGYEDGTFVPQGSLTRAEMAVVLYRVTQL